MTRKHRSRAPTATGVNLATVLAILAITTGCISEGAPDPGADAAPDPGADAAPDPGADETPTEEPAQPDRTPAPAPVEEEPGETAEAPRVVERRGQISFTLGVGLLCMEVEKLGCGLALGYLEFAEFALTEADPTNATLTATWESTLSASEYVLSVRHEAGEERTLLARRSGPSPLVVDLPVDALPAGGLITASAFPSPVGVMTQENVIDVLLRLEYA